MGDWKFLAKNCPRCGSDEISYGRSHPPMQGHVECHADGCEALTVDRDTDTALRLWNAGVWQRRIVDRDEDGHPCEYEDNPGLAATAILEHDGRRSNSGGA